MHLVVLCKSEFDANPGHCNVYMYTHVPSINDASYVQAIPSGINMRCICSSCFEGIMCMLVAQVAYSIDIRVQRARKSAR